MLLINSQKYLNKRGELNKDKKIMILHTKIQYNNNNVMNKQGRS